MAAQLLLDDITDGSRVELGVIKDSMTPVGRDPDDGGITLPSSAISSNHGYFVRNRNAWFFIDNGSTNGSWVNGNIANPGEYRIVRAGSVLQFADRAFQLSTMDSTGVKVQHQPVLEQSPEMVGGRSVYLFNGHEFDSEFSAPQGKRCVSVGGAETDIKIDGYAGKRPAIIIEDRNGKLTVYGLALEEAFSVNGEECRDQKVTLKDNDIVQFRKLSFLVNDPLHSLDPDTADQRSASEILNTLGVKGWQQASEVRSSVSLPGWEDEKKARNIALSGFGQQVEEHDESSDDGDYGYDSLRSGSFKELEPDKAEVFEKIEDRVTMVVGGLLLLGILGVVLWWLIKVAK
jgi:pSer/pThr/pTyr-binding forkhead associated (FHA) protein